MQHQRSRLWSTALTVLSALTLGLAAAYLLAALVFVPWEIAEEKVQSASLTTSGKDLPGELVAQGWLSANEVRHGERLRLWVSFQNVSKRQIKDLRIVDFEAPGFTKEPPCWNGELPVCLDPAQPRRGAIPTELAPGQSLTVAAELKPAERVGRYALFAVFDWTDAAGGTLRKALPLGPVQVTTWWHEAGRRLLSLTRDLALPVLAAFLALLYQVREKRQEHARAAEAERNQVVNTLLPQFLSDAQKYYMPLASALDVLIGRAGRASATPAADTREFFFRFAAFLRRMAFTSDEIGGFNFQDRRGEKVAGLAWEAFRQNTSAQLTPGALAAALDAIGTDESLATFNAKLLAGDANADSLLELERRFTAWVVSPGQPFERQLPLLKLLWTSLVFETNRPLDVWYGSPDEFPATTLTDLRLPAEPAEIISQLRAALGVYIKAGVEKTRKP